MMQQMLSFFQSMSSQGTGRLLELQQPAVFAEQQPTASSSIPPGSTLSGPTSTGQSFGWHPSAGGILPGQTSAGGILPGQTSAGGGRLIIHCINNLCEY